MTSELLVYRLLTLHNVSFFQRLLGDMREAIAARRFEAFRARVFERYGVSSAIVSADDDANLET
jgi:tRNA-guanine family transglycosylase